MKKRTRATIDQLKQTDILDLEKGKISVGGIITLSNDFAQGEIPFCPVLSIEHEGKYVSCVKVFEPAKAEIVEIRLPDWIDKAFYIPTDMNGRQLMASELMLAGSQVAGLIAPVVPPSETKSGSWLSPAAGVLYTFIQPKESGSRHTVMGFRISKKDDPIFRSSARSGLTGDCSTEVLYVRKVFRGRNSLSRAQEFAGSLLIPGEFAKYADDLYPWSRNRKQIAVRRANTFVADGGELFFASDIVLGSLTTK